MPVEQAGKIWRITGIKSIKGEGDNWFYIVSFPSDSMSKNVVTVKPGLRSLKVIENDIVRP